MHKRHVPVRNARADACSLQQHQRHKNHACLALCLTLPQLCVQPLASLVNRQSNTSQDEQNYLRHRSKHEVPSQHLMPRGRAGGDELDSPAQRPKRANAQSVSPSARKTAAQHFVEQADNARQSPIGVHACSCAFRVLCVLTCVRQASHAHAEHRR